MAFEVAAIVKYAGHLDHAILAAAGAREGRETRFLATLALGGYLGGDFLSDLIHKSIEVLHRFKLDAFAAVELIEAFHGGGAEPFDLGLVFLLALLQQPEAFAHHFASIAEAAGGHARLDKAVEMFREIDVAGWQVKVLL